MSWTDDRVEQLKKLWMDGLSASQIAQELGGITRNAVIGKVHRLGMSGRAKSPSHVSANRQKRVQRQSFAKPARPAQQRLPVEGRPRPAETAFSPRVEEALVAPVPLKLELTQLTERTCKWPLGDPALPDFHFCGHGSAETGPYCAYHARIAYQAIPERRRERRSDGSY